MLPEKQHQQKTQPPRTRRRRSAFTLVEVIVALVVACVVAAMVASQLIESVSLNIRISDTLEHSRSARELFNTLSADVRAAQIITLHPSFADRSTTARDGQFGNYVVLQNLDDSGNIIRTVGFYTVALSGGSGWAVYRHDSDAGHHAAASLPSTGSQGTHRLVKWARRLPDAGNMFRCARDRGISIHGEFAPVDARGSGKPEFIRCTILTRS